jgi:hypothetical protein
METKNIDENEIINNPHFFIGTLILISFIILLIRFVLWFDKLKDIKKLKTLISILFLH